MEWYEIAVDGGRTLKFPTRGQQPATARQHEQKHSHQNVVAAAADEDNTAAPQQLGGIIKRGAWGWLTSGGNALEITALRTGQTIATYEFTEARGYDNCSIRCVEELFPLQSTDSVLLAVCLECFRAAGGGCTFVAIYSIEHGQVLSCMELPVHVTAAAFVSGNCCRRSLLQNFDGCLAVGSEEGVILLLDLNISKTLETLEERMGTPLVQSTERITPCQIADYNLPLADIHRTFRQTRQDHLHFGLQVEVIDTPCSVQCLLPIDLALGLAIGFEDGRLAFYDLAELQIIHIAAPQQQQAMSPVVKLSYLEPLDDPRHCLYVWAMHENGENLSAVLHTLIYEKRLTEKDDFYYFETFLRSTVRLQIPLEATKSVAINCQSVNKIQNNNLNTSSLNDMLHNNTTHSDEDGYCLCAMTWYSTLEEKNKLLIFDLNQWYKEEMPYSMIQQKCPTYLAGYVLSGRQCALSAYLNPNTVAHFNSLQRYEEHFYPNSLSFDCVLLLEQGTLGYTWIGAQNKIVNILRASNSSIFLDPDMYFREILRTRLLPQFSELNADSTFSRPAIYETILSVSLEHNCYSLLRDCAKCWADGSFMGSSFTATTGISLSTLTEWIWKRATDIKTRCNDLSKGLFDYNSYPLDQREQKELAFLTRQLKLLGDLFSEVLCTGKRYIPNKVFTNLETQHNSIRMASEYQDVLLWLLNIGLLPEMQRKRINYSPHNLHTKALNNKMDSGDTIQYPFNNLKDLYERKRKFFACINDNFVSKKTGSCRLLFIDALITHECKADSLRECWLENGGNGLYPPPSIEAMLRVMLVPEMEFESKCAILLYFFLDLHMTIDEQAHKEIVESFVKFPSVFKLTATLIKTVQSLWNLDHGLFMPAVDEFISPFNNNQTYPQWMVELLIESLLTQNAANYALRILEARPTLISPILKLNTLLANDLISEAFHFARTKHDDKLLEFFFNICLCAGKYGVIRDLALSEHEGQLVQRILRNSKTNGAENLHFVYLLQKSKYIEAVSYLDELSRSKSNMRSHYGLHESSGGGIVSNADTPNLVLSAFNTTMAPVTQGLTDVYFRIKNKIKKKEADNRSPVPLSCQLIKQNANNLLGGIYHSSALSAHFATYYWGEMDVNDARKGGSASGCGANSLLSAQNAPFLRKPQAETCNFQRAQYAPTDVSYPQPYRATEKRTLAESELEQDDATAAEALSIALNTNAQPRKRRRLLGHEIVEDLGHFMQNNKSASQLTARGFDLEPAAAAEKEVEAPQEKITPNKTRVNYLTQPITTPRRGALETFDESRLSRAPGARATSELHSILKTTNTPDRNVRAYSLRRELHATLDESKNLRFQLPATEIMDEKRGAKERSESCEKLATPETQAITSCRRKVTTTTSVDENEEDVPEKLKLVAVPEDVETKELSQEDVEMADDEIVDEVVIEVRHEAPNETTPASAKRREVVATYTASVDRAQRQQQIEEQTEEVEGLESANESQEEDDNFYSPLSSRNNSLIAEEVNSPAALQATQQTLGTGTPFQTALAKILHFSGPQPRRPLARLSAERSQSRTPEKKSPAPVSEEKGKEADRHQLQPAKSMIENQPSSGYVSATSFGISGATSIPTVSEPAFEIKSVISLASSDFTPRSSSSKLYSTQSKLHLDETKIPTQTKLSECSTVVGSFSVDEECVLGLSTDETDKTSKHAKSYQQLQTISEQPMNADTTLGMSSYEFTMPQIKSQVTMQANTSTETMEAKHKAAILTSMETVEVMDLDEEVENVNEHDDDKEVPSMAYATEVESDLFAEAIGLTAQQTEGADGADSNDMVALYESRRAEMVEERNAQAAPNESNDSSVIVLSSSGSSDNMSANNEVFDSDVDADDLDDYCPGRAVDDTDDDDEDDEEESDYDDQSGSWSGSGSGSGSGSDGESEGTADKVEDDENWDDERNEEGCTSSIEVVNGGNSSERTEEERPEVSNVDTSESTQGREDAFDYESGQTDEAEGSEEQKLVTATNSSEPQSTSNGSSQSRNVGASNDSSKSANVGATDDSSKSANVGASNDSSKSANVGASNDSSQSALCSSVESESRIVVEEAASSCVDFEELVMRETIEFVKSEDEQQDNAEDKSFFSSRSVFMQNESEITIDELKVSTYKASSKEVYEELSSDVFYCDAESTSESLKESKKPDIEIDFAAASTSSKAKEGAEETQQNEAAQQSEKESSTSRPVSSTDANARTEKDGLSSSIDTKATENVEEQTSEAQKKKEIENRGEDKMEKENNTEAEPEEEEQFKLHVDEADLSETEDPNPTIKFVAEAGTKESVEKEMVVEECASESQADDKRKGSTKERESQTASDTLNKPEGSPKTPPSVVLKTHKQLRSTFSAQLQEKEAEALVSTPTRRRSSHRGTSVPPPLLIAHDSQTPLEEVGTPQKRSKRGISVPPQTRAQQELDAAANTPELRVSSRRSMRASSAQPSDEIGTPRTRRSVRGVSMPHDNDENVATPTTTPARAARGTSVPPNSAGAKIVTRRRSALLDAINESVPIVDSPSARTRSRMRLNSAESELDASIVSSSEQAPQAKRPRRRNSSVSSSVISEQPSTPSGRRTRNSLNSATVETSSEVGGGGGGTPRATRRTTRRRESIDATQHPEHEEPQHDDEHSAAAAKEAETKTNAENAATDSTLYSSARRLTRTQLAMMEKSAALSKNLNMAEFQTSAAHITSPSTKRISKRRTSRSTVQDSDDVESVSSRMSNVSGTLKGRRVTRSSVKDKEEHDDDLVSVASSVGSERSMLKRRSKESKASPSTVLTTIQEDEAEEPSQSKRSRATKKRLS